MFDLDSAQLEAQESARETARLVEPFADEADAATTLHQQTHEVLQASGLARFAVPKRFGGADDRLDPLKLAVVREQLMYVSAHADSMFGMQGVGSYPLAIGGSDAVREEWLPKVASLDAIAAIALTEPDIGSDLRGVTTTIEEAADGLRVRGRKAFITNAGAAHFFCVLGREGEGYSMAFVPADTPGVTVTSGPDLVAPHILGQVDLDVVVPADHRLGEQGKAFSLMLQTLAVFRVTVAGSAVGLAQAALDEAVAHTTERQQFGKPLIDLGAVGQGLAMAWAEVESARAITYRAAALAGPDPLRSLDMTSIAKVSATEAAGRVVDRCVQSMGRFGLIHGAKIERLARNARPTRIYEGSTEVLLDALARQLRNGARR